jgi:hypothetical protein
MSDPGAILDHMPVDASHPAALNTRLERDQYIGGLLVLQWSNLRYVLTMNLAVHGPMTIKEMIAMMTEQGFTTAGRPSKCISDALRTERARGRVWRRGRGRYGPGSMPRSTEYRVHKRWIDLRERSREHRAQACREVTPPSTTICVPVMNEAFGDIRNATAAPISAG